MTVSVEARPRTRIAARRSRRAQRARRRVVTVIHYAVLIVLVALSFAIVFLMIDLSLRPGLVIYLDFWRLPWPPYFGNYRRALLDLLWPLARTLVVAVGSIAGVLVISALASYAIARLRFLGRNLFFYLILAVMMVPSIILLTPHFILANQLHVNGSLWSLVLFYVAGGLPFGIFLITTFFQAQAAEIFEAARVDGASELRALWSIAIPLAAPILVTVAILDFVSFYGDFIWPTLMLSEHNQTLLMALQAYNPQVNQFQSRPDFGLQAAGYTFATIPQLIVFTAGMKYFVQGVSSGAVKA